MFARPTIREACAAGLVLAAASAFPTERLAVGGLGESPFADGETSATFALPRPSEKNWRLTLSLAGTSGNRAEVAFGRDANTNAVLDAEEVSAVIAWEQGAWRVTGGAGLEERYEAAPVRRAGGAADTLTLDVRFGGDGAAASAAFSGGGGSAQTGAPLAFGGLPAAPPPWLDPRRWDTGCIKARGFGPRAEAARISAFPDGTSVRLK